MRNERREEFSFTNFDVLLIWSWCKSLMPWVDPDSSSLSSDSLEWKRTLCCTLPDDSRVKVTHTANESSSLFDVEVVDDVQNSNDPTMHFVVSFRLQEENVLGTVQHHITRTSTLFGLLSNTILNCIDPSWTEIFDFLGGRTLICQLKWWWANRSNFSMYQTKRNDFYLNDERPIF